MGVRLADQIVNHILPGAFLRLAQQLVDQLSAGALLRQTKAGKICVDFAVVVIQSAHTGVNF